MSEYDDWNKSIIAEFRANAGVVGGQFAGAPMILVNHTGAKSGTAYTTPLVYQPNDKGPVIFASKAGADTHPHWYLNLLAHPVITVEVGAETYSATAVEVTGDERDQLFAKQVELMPTFGDYAKKTERLIPVIRIERV
jgi:deazaflavin-dependent oxidoreductase (nitroreductase family)